MIDEAVVARLEALYATLPALECKGLCEDSCGPINASETELERIRERGVDVLQRRADLVCPALSKTFGPGRCSVYSVRPMVCRLWGVSETMPCDHGCVPVGGHLDDGDALRLLADSISIGGRGDDRGVEEARELLELALADPQSKKLLGALARGDKSVEGELSRRLRVVQGGKRRKRRR